MNANAEKWVAALRSGEFKQGLSFLRKDDEYYCCLGVACEVYRRETGEGEWSRSDMGQAAFIVGSDAEEAVLPAPVTKWLGLKNNMGASGDRASLVTRNDNGHPFERIADYIESEPRGLFK